MPSPTSRFSYLETLLNEACEEQHITGREPRVPDVSTLLTIYDKLVVCLHEEDEPLNVPILSAECSWREREQNKLYKWIGNQIRKYAYALDLSQLALVGLLNY